MRELSRQELVDIIYGCTVLGTGGGGSLEGGLAIIEKDLEEGLKFYLESPEDIPDEAYIACPYVCGSISPQDADADAKYAGLPSMEVTEAMRAFQVMEDYYGKEFYGVIATELGGENTADALHVAARLGKALVDGDPAGRSVPELQHSTFYIKGVPITPIAISTPFGDTAVINNVVNDFRAEALIRAMSVVSKDAIGVADHPTTGRVLKSSVIPGTITMAMEIGRVLRESLARGDDPAEDIARIAGGKIVFRGRVSGNDWDTVDGFTVGTVSLAGMDDYAGSAYRIWYKNEHIISYLDDEADVTVPDLICIIDKDGVPVTNPFYEAGMELTVFALPAPSIWKTEKGLEIFGPRSFGFDLEYSPIEDRII